MASDLLPSWEHPGLDNSSSKQEHHPSSRFGNGSSHMDQSLKGKNKRNPSIKLKHPPLSSIYTDGGPGHRRMPSIDTSGHHQLRGGEMPKKKPPDPGFQRRKTDGDLPRRIRRVLNPGDANGGTDFVFDSIPTSPLRAKSMKRPSASDDPASSKGEDRDSTTCSETRSVSSSSLQSPTTDQSATSSGQLLGEIQQMSGSSKRHLMPDESAASYSILSLKDPAPKGGGSSKAEPYAEDPPIPRSVEPRYDHDRRTRETPRHPSTTSRQSSRRHYAGKESQPPPLAPYDDSYSRSSNRYREDEESYYSGRPPPHGGQSRAGGGGAYHHHHRIDDSASGFHDSRSRMNDSRSRYEDDNISRMSRSSRFHDDRSRAGGGYDGGGYQSRHYPRSIRHNHAHDPYEDDNVSRISRSSRYHEGRSGSRIPDDDVASRRSVPRYPRGDQSVDGGASRHSRMSRSGGYREQDISHTSRYQMDRATGYHHGNHRDRYYHEEERSRYSHHQEPHRHQHHPHQPHHHRGGGYDDERSRCDDRSRGPRYQDDRSRCASRYPDERSRYHDRDDGSTIVTSYSRHDRYNDSYRRYADREDGYSRGGGRGGEEGYPREDPYVSGGRSLRDGHGAEEPYPPRPDPYSGGRSTHSREEYDRPIGNGRRDGGSYQQQERPEDGYGDRRPPAAAAASSSRRDDLYEAKMRAFGLRNDTVKEKEGQENKEGDVYVEIGFGAKEKLRRTKETMDAIARDFYAPAACFACNNDLFCIADVKYLVCPKCKTISPAEAASSGEGGTATSFDGTPVQRHGVGLGFTYDTLFRMQSEVMQKRGEARAAKAGY